MKHCHSQNFPSDQHSLMRHDTGSHPPSKSQKDLDLLRLRMNNKKDKMEEKNITFLLTLITRILIFSQSTEGLSSIKLRHTRAVSSTVHRRHIESPTTLTSRLTGLPKYQLFSRHFWGQQYCANTTDYVFIATENYIRCTTRKRICCWEETCSFHPFQWIE